MSQVLVPIACYSLSEGNSVAQRKQPMVESQLTDAKAAAYTARVPSWMREITRSVAMALAALIACAIVVLTAGFVVSALF
jgi:hypothetical protein